MFRHEAEAAATITGPEGPVRGTLRRPDAKAERPQFLAEATFAGVSGGDGLTPKTANRRLSRSFYLMPLPPIAWPAAAVARSKPATEPALWPKYQGHAGDVVGLLGFRRKTVGGIEHAGDKRRHGGVPSRVE